MGVQSSPQNQESDADSGGLSRRRFLGFVVAASTLTVAAHLGEAAAAPAEAAGATTGLVPSAPGQAEIYDLNDMLTHAALPTANLISITIDSNGTASLALPRAEVGQGITTSSAILIAEELDLPLDKVKVTLADARPELLFNQLTGGSNTTISTFTPIRVAAAVARGRLLEAAALELGEAIGTLTAKAGSSPRRPDGVSPTVNSPRRPPPWPPARSPSRSRTPPSSRSSVPAGPGLTRWTR